jgi:hypothetical protein
MRTITRLLVCAVAILALAAGPAFAQTEDAYNGLAGAQQGGGGDEAAADTGSSLPFTGLELGLVAIAGAGLLGVGYAVRRASNPRESTP